MSVETIDHKTLTKLVEAGAVRGAHAVAQGGSWSVLVKYGKVERPLATDRSRDVRLFRKLDTLTSYLLQMGIAHFEVDAEKFDPTQPGYKRPDRSEALRKAHEAAAYDKWFREQVQASIDDPRPSIPSEEVEAYFDNLCAKLQGAAK